MDWSGHSLRYSYLSSLLCRSRGFGHVELPLVLVELPLVEVVHHLGQVGAGGGEGTPWSPS